MQVMDIVQAAASKAGIIPSFNPDEMPGDVLDAGRTILTNEILPGINCDRTLDVTVTSRVYRPVNGVIKLVPFKQPEENTEIIGYSKYSSTELLDKWNTLWRQEIKRLRDTYLDNALSMTPYWETNALNVRRYLAMWTTDMQLVIGNSITEAPTIEGANIDFPPMRVDAVLEESARWPYEYVYREEFEKIIGQDISSVYTTEEYDDALIVLLKGTPQEKRLILPVPLQIVDRDHSRSGTIIAPEKFRRYLIDATAVSLAIVYGVSTVQLMQQQAAQSYNMLKKNKTQPLHPADPAENIQDNLRFTRSRRSYRYVGF